MEKTEKQYNSKKNYEFIIQTDSYTGNFVREFIGYVIGILDDVQMGINHSEEYRSMFWREEFNLNNYSGQEMYNGVDSSDNQTENYIEFHNYLNYLPNGYDLYEKFLKYTFQTCDDWKQHTFYHIESLSKYLDNESFNSSTCDSIIIQLKKPLDEKWEKIIVNRTIKFFDKNVRQDIENNNIQKLNKEYHRHFSTKTVPEIKLLNLLLINKSKEIIKNYNI